MRIDRYFSLRRGPTLGSSVLLIAVTGNEDVMLVAMAARNWGHGILIVG